MTLPRGEADVHGKHEDITGEHTLQQKNLHVTYCIITINIIRRTSKLSVVYVKRRKDTISQQVPTR